MGRVKFAARNIAFGYVGNILTLLGGFILRTVFISHLGKTLLGVDGLYTEILSALSMAELGIGTALNYSLYAPVARRDIAKIKSYMVLYKKAYRIIGCVVAVIGIAIIPFLPALVKNPGQLSNTELTLYYVLFLFNTVSTYFVAYKYSLVNAEQKNYIQTNVITITKLITMALQIAVIFITHNFLFYLLTAAVVELLQKIFVSIYLNRRYPYLKDRNAQKLSKEETGEIVTKTKALVFHKVGDVARLQTDSMIISAFIDVGLVGMLGNYKLVISSVSNFVNIIFNSVLSSFGNLIATESRQKQYGAFRIYRFLACWIYGFSAVGFGILLTPLIGLWLGEQWALGTAVISCILIDYYFKGDRIVLSNFKTAAGVFEQDKYLALIQGVVNLVISIVLVMKIGLVGVYIGTIVSGLIANVTKPYIIYKHILHKPVKEYFLDSVRYLVVLLVALGASLYVRSLLMSEITYVTFVLMCVAITIIFNGMYCLVFHKTEEFQYLWKLIKNKLPKKMLPKKRFPKKTFLSKAIHQILSAKLLAICTTVAFAASMLPVCFLSFVNRAAGDDYGYGTLTHMAWKTTHSVVALLKAAGETIVQYYYGWQGTWFSIFLFSMQPEVFHDNAYWIVAFLMLFLWIASTVLLFRLVLKEQFGFSKWYRILLVVLFLGISIQLIPSTKSSIFWFNGAAHYMVPFAMCQTLLYCLLRFSKTFQKRQLFFIVLLMTLLGGANYQAALFALLVTIYVLIGTFLTKKTGKVFWLLLPIACNLIGLIISMLAPGNKVRGGAEFGFSIIHVAEAIGKCFLWGIRDVGNYAVQKPLMFVGFGFLLVIALTACQKQDKSDKPAGGLWSMLAGWTVYFAMQAPAAYAGVEVSRGVKNTNFQVFMLACMLTILYLARKLSQAAVCRRTIQALNRRYLVILYFLFGFVFLFLFRGTVKETTTWVCMEYIVSGQAEDYRQQMELQTELLTDSAVTDVVLPFINDEQGPLMHMSVTADQTAWTNTVTREFYGKHSVIAMPRPDWEARYR